MPPIHASRIVAPRAPVVTRSPLSAFMKDWLQPTKKQALALKNLMSSDANALGPIAPTTLAGLSAGFGELAASLSGAAPRLATPVTAPGARPASFVADYAVTTGLSAAFLAKTGAMFSDMPEPLRRSLGMTDTERFTLASAFDRAAQQRVR